VGLLDDWDRNYVGFDKNRSVTSGSRWTYLIQRVRKPDPLASSKADSAPRGAFGTSGARARAPDQFLPRTQIEGAAR
jgi:hypothetical protein